MKIHLLIIFLWLSISNLIAQEIDVPDFTYNNKGSKVEYADVIQLPGVSSQQIYERAENWINTFYKNPKGVIQEKIPESGKIRGEHRFPVYKMVKKDKMQNGNMKYTIVIAAKDGRYRYIISNIYKLTSPKVYIEEWVEMEQHDEATAYTLTQIDEFFITLIDDLVEAMAQPLEDDTNDDDW